MPYEEAQNFSFRGFARLIRLNNLLILVFSQYMVGACLLASHHRVYGKLWVLKSPHFLILSLSTVLIAAAGYIINDYYDIKIDTVNKPERVVIDKRLKRRVAMGAHTVLNLLGIGLGMLLGFKIGLVNVASAYLLWLYSNMLKRLPFTGNLTVALLTATAIMLPAIYYKQNVALIGSYAIFALFITLIREIIKDMEDMRGDSAFGCRTLPIIWGIRRTKYLIYVILATFVVVLFVLSDFLSRQVSFYFLALMLPLLVFLYQLVRADTVRDYASLSNFCKYMMLAGTLSMALV